MTAAAMTYNSLFSDIQMYLERGTSTQNDPDVYNQIPRFIMMAEQRLALELKVLGSVKMVTTTLTAGAGTLLKPVRWRDTVSMSYLDATGQRLYIYPREYEFCRSFWPTATLQGAPRYYADYDYNNWLIVPTPDSGYTVEIGYYERIVPLDSSNQTNFYTNYCPQILLYACLWEAMVFLKDDDRIAVWQGQYDRAMQAMSGENKERQEDRSQKRDQ